MMGRERLEARAAKRAWGDNVDILLRQRGENGVISFGKSVQMVEGNDYTIQDETFSLGPTAAQQLMDDLWAAGVRPTEGQGSAGQIGAVQAHLADMRKLVFDSPTRGVSESGQAREDKTLFPGDLIKQKGEAFYHVRTGIKLCVVEADK